MRILHFIPYYRQPKEWLLPLLETLREQSLREEVHIAYIGKFPDADMANVVIHKVGEKTRRYNSKMRLGRMLNTVSRLRRSLDSSTMLATLCKIMPDIVHIHGCWDRSVSSVMQIAQSRGFITVYSPHNEINNNIIRGLKWNDYKLSYICYQRKMFKRADHIIAESGIEYNSLRRVKWMPHVEMVENSDILSSQEAALALEAYYQKVIDSHNYKRMTVNDKEAVCSLMHVGLEQENVHNILSASNLLNLRNLTSAQWRRIMLMAYDENIMYIVAKAIERERLQVADISPEDIDRFDTVREKNRYPLKTEYIDDEHKAVKKRLHTLLANDPAEIRRIVYGLYNLKQLYSKHDMTLRHLSDIYEVIKYQNYDEKRLDYVLQASGLWLFTSHILQILSETHYLEDGYMPIKPTNDKDTEKMRKAIVATFR